MATISINTKKHIARLLLCIFVFQIVSPAQLMALTGGPSQPEMQAFQPAGTTDMVDLFSGDFNYNIPLFELPGPNGGYPFSLSYQSGVTLDQEASWVGLGWSLNPGAITRQMRGLPDDFKGDVINTKLAIDPSVTVGIGVGLGLELFGAAKDVGTLGLSIFRNNYKGLGYTIDGTVGFGTAVNSGMTAGVGLNVSLNSQEGINISPSVGLKGKMGEFSLRGGYNSRSGFDQVSFKTVSNFSFKDKDKNAKTSSGESMSTLTLAHPGYTPQIGMPMRNDGFSAKFNPGVAWWGVMGKAYIKGFYNEQRLAKSVISSNGYGYVYSDKSVGDVKGLLDFNREKDGIVSKETSNLGIPSMTYDIYSVTGQGHSAMYRPVRNDIGILHDQEVSSESSSGSIGVDAAPTTAHVGVNLSVNHAKSTSGAWTANNSMAAIAAFEKNKLDDPFEPWMFKAHGEMTGESAANFNKVGGSAAVRVQLQGANSQSTASATLENKSWNQALTASSLDRTRKQRNNAIQPLTNAQVRTATVQGELVSFYKNQYIDSANNTVPFDRTSVTRYPGHHFAGFTSLTPDGLRYNYTIPALNLNQEEVTFSAAKSIDGHSKVSVGSDLQDPAYQVGEKFLKKVTMPKYAHSFLLTSVVGADYVDKTGDGVTTDDLGYWVKFTYKKTTGIYKWRDPFVKAHYQEGEDRHKRRQRNIQLRCKGTLVPGTG